MKEFTIRFNSVQDVQKFVDLSTAQPFPISIGNENHQVNGKSFMEIFSLSFDRPLTVSMDCTEEQYQAFLQQSEAPRTAAPEYSL